MIAFTDAELEWLMSRKVCKLLTTAAEGKQLFVQKIWDVETGQVLARYQPPEPEGDGPSLANSVRRMRAANDRLKEALVPPGRTKRG